MLAKTFAYTLKIYSSLVYLSIDHLFIIFGLNMPILYISLCAFRSIYIECPYYYGSSKSCNYFVLLLIILRLSVFAVQMLSFS